MCDWIKPVILVPIDGLKLPSGYKLIQVLDKPEFEKRCAYRDDYDQFGQKHSEPYPGACSALVLQTPTYQLAIYRSYITRFVDVHGNGYNHPAIQRRADPDTARLCEALNECRWFFKLPMDKVQRIPYAEKALDILDSIKDTVTSVISSWYPGSC